MPLKDTIRVVQSGNRRVKIFVDFWNLILNARKSTDQFDIDIDWNALANFVLHNTRIDYSDESSGSLAGMFIYGGYKVSDPNQQKLVQHVLGKYGGNDGLFFEFVELQKRPQKIKCSNCGEVAEKNFEVGVDVHLAVEVIKHSQMEHHEYIAIVSSDQDYIPLFTYLKDRGHRVINVATDQEHKSIRAITWKQIGLKTHYPQLCKIMQNATYSVYTTSFHQQKTKELTDFFSEKEIDFQVFDIADVNSIGDKDLSFLLANQNMHFQDQEVERQIWYNWQHFTADISKFRQLLSTGSIISKLPYVMTSGTMAAYPDDEFGWITAAQVNGDINPISELQNP